MTIHVHYWTYKNLDEGAAPTVDNNATISEVYDDYTQFNLNTPELEPDSNIELRLLHTNLPVLLNALFNSDDASSHPNVRLLRHALYMTYHAEKALLEDEAYEPNSPDEEKCRETIMALEAILPNKDTH